MTEDGCRRDAAALVARVGCAAHFARLAREAGISVREFGAPPDAGLACSAAVLRRRRVVGRCCRRQGHCRAARLALTPTPTLILTLTLTPTLTLAVTLTLTLTLTLTITQPQPEGQKSVGQPRLTRNAPWRQRAALHRG